MGKEIKMTKFEQIGVNIQYNSPTKEIAQENFSRSCECCCNRGLYIKCNRCAIEVTHKLVIASFETEREVKQLCLNGK